MSKTFLSKFNLVALTAVSDANFANTIWLEQILEDSEGYSVVQETVPLTTEDLNIGRTHTFKFRTADHSQFASIIAESKINTPYRVHAFGAQGYLLWEQSTKFTVKEIVDTKTKTVKYLEITFKQYGSGLSIRSGINLLDKALSSGDGSVIVDLEEDCAFSQGETANGGFTTANGKVFKLDQSTPSIEALVFVILKYPIPVREGMSFSVRGDMYAYNGSGTKLHGFEVEVVDSVGLSTGTFIAQSSSNGLTSAALGSDELLIPAYSTHIKRFGFRAVSSASAGVVEYDNLLLKHNIGPDSDSGNLLTFYTEN